MKIYICKVSQLFQQYTGQEIYEQIPQERRRSAHACKNEADRRRSLAVSPRAVFTFIYYHINALMYRSLSSEFPAFFPAAIRLICTNESSLFPLTNFFNFYGERHPAHRLLSDTDSILHFWRYARASKTEKQPLCIKIALLDFNSCRILKKIHCFSRKNRL